MLCYSLAERSVLGETMPSGYTQDLGHNTDRPKPLNNIFIFFLLKFEIFWELSKKITAIIYSPVFISVGWAANNQLFIVTLLIKTEFYKAP